MSKLYKRKKEYVSLSFAYQAMFSYNEFCPGPALCQTKILKKKQNDSLSAHGIVLYCLNLCLWISLCALLKAEAHEKKIFS